MKQSDTPFFLSLVASLALHGAGLIGLPRQEAPAAATPRPALHATLAPQPAALPPPLPELHLDPPEPAAPEPPPASPRKERPLRKAPAGGPPPGEAPLAREARRQIARLASRGDFYPLEAIHQGLEGEAWVQIFLDADGHVIAARIDRSSGHALLDQAALRAARALRSLPADGLEEAVLPVRFRLE
ncbi:energy transducer TonB [Azovibrio restrictus]|uniref:energy transducer TonB n=1 Tax=Azovibrio restrictus TaxID=146938 RepID=UPI0026EBF30A|nr:TonB family protein [Azovibrio restrictus]